MDELTLLVKGVLADLAGAGALADALQESGRDREAVLLRRRWKQWDKQWRAANVRGHLAVQLGTMYKPGTPGYAGAVKRFAGIVRERIDRTFARYIRSKFLPKRKIMAQVTPHECQVGRSCTCSVAGLEPAEDCPIHGWPGSPRCDRCGRMMKWSARATT